MNGALDHRIISFVMIGMTDSTMSNTSAAANYTLNLHTLCILIT